MFVSAYLPLSFVSVFLVSNLEHWTGYHYILYKHCALEVNPCGNLTFRLYKHYERL